MSDIIQLLPDSVANQIAAGEVIQRPASLLKELMENSVDAGATSIQIVVKDAGRTLVQVIDNGSGMSETDARMAFERHATSKIKNAADLFALKTMGFRGEALASIAAVAHVELNTRSPLSELGTRIVISGSEIELQQPVNCPVGSNFLIKNLFYNVPARRRFLKSNATELRHIISEFQRVALANPEVGFTLSHNDQPIFNLPAGNLKQRITGVMGKQIQSHLIPVNTDATVVTIHGFAGKPQAARKSPGDQFFFVNNRYMRHPYLHKAVLDAYANLIASDAYPAYFLFFDINPELIDVNIHPTKTEIKFEDEKLIWKVLNASVREGLGKYNEVPSIDFDTDDQINIPVLSQSHDIQIPSVPFNFDYNPFNSQGQSRSSSNTSNSFKQEVKGWESLYNDFESPRETDWSNTPETITLQSRGNNVSPIQEVPKLLQEAPISGNIYFQVKNRFILTPVKSGLMIIDQRRAHERILFEQFLSAITTNRAISQQLLFPETLEFSPADAMIISDISDDLKIFGIDLRDSGNGLFMVQGLPCELENTNCRMILDRILDSYKSGEVNPEEEIREQLAAIMARNACMNHGETLSSEDMSTLVNRLFRCQMPNYTPSGKPVISIVENEELDGRFK
jgi:DNA mismatch repair protein MutL